MNNKKIKLFLYPVLYWIIFVIIPFVIAINLENYNPALNIPGVIMSYIIFIAPFLFFVPYRLVEFKNTNQKLMFILMGIIIPYIILYIYIYYKIIEAFSKSKFPF